MAKYIRSVFPDITIKSQEELNCTRVKFATKELAEVIKVLDGKALFSKSSNLMIAGFPHDVEHFYKYNSEIFKEFTFNKSLLQCSQEFLQNVKLKHSFHNQTGKEILLVGVHVRRTDYKEWLAKWENAKLVTPGYLARAMDEFRRRYPLSEVVFVVASDDIKWCKQHLSKLRNVYFTSANHSCGIDMAKFDFAVLVQCQHSIMT